MKIIFFNPCNNYHVVVMPLVPLLLKKYIGSEFEIILIDDIFRKDWRKDLTELLKREEVLCAAVSALTGNPITTGLEFSKMVKELTNWKTPVVWGGVHPTLLPLQTIANPHIDYVVFGEGEMAFAKLVKSIANNKTPAGIGNICWKNNGIPIIEHQNPYIDLNTLSFLDYDYFGIEKYITNLIHGPRSFELITSRGCPFECAYCYNVAVNKRTYRYKSSEVVVAELEEIINKYQITDLHFREDEFFIRKKRVLEIMEGIVLKNLNFNWSADITIKLFNNYSKTEKEFLHLLKRSGCKKLIFGVESGDEFTLKKIKKHLKPSDVIRTSEILRDVGIKGFYHFMIGFPFEKRENIINTFNFMSDCLETNPDITFYGPSIYTPYPGAELYKQAIESGFKEPKSLQDWAKHDWERVKAYNSHDPFIRNLITFAPIFGTLYNKDRNRILFRLFLKLNLSFLRKFSIFWYLEGKILIFAQKIFRYLKRVTYSLTKVSFQNLKKHL